MELDRSGRVIVNPDLSVPGHPEIFAIGDLALVRDERGQPVPGVSPAAMQMARHTARLIEDDLNNENTNPRTRPAFKYWDKGTMATIGRSAAVAQIGRLELSGWPAWAVWLSVHLIFLIGFRNRLAVLLQWTYSYFTYKLGSRIITGLDDSHETVPDADEDPNVCRYEKIGRLTTTSETDYDPNQTSLRTSRKSRWPAVSGGKALAARLQKGSTGIGWLVQGSGAQP